MIDCPHCGSTLDIAIRAGSCPHCNGNLASNSVLEEEKKKREAIPTGTLDLSSFVAIEKHNLELETAAKKGNNDSGDAPTGDNGNAPAGAPRSAKSGKPVEASPFATLMPEPQPSAIPTVEGGTPHSSTVAPQSAPPSGGPPTHIPTVDAGPLTPPQSQDPPVPQDPPGVPTIVGGKTMSASGDATGQIGPSSIDPVPVDSDPADSGPADAPRFSGTLPADQTMVQSPGGVPPTGPPNSPMYENTIPTVQAGTSDTNKTVGSDAGMGPPGRSSAGIKQLWEGFADSRVGPMASIKSDDMSVGRDDGLVIHRRQLAPADAPKAQEADYMVVSYLGQGAMGVVFEANQTSMQRGVAIKTLRPELARKSGDRQKFLYEAAITGDLDHPNIVPIHDVGVNQDGTVFYSMKRVEGTPWQNVMHTKSRAENLEILMKVADAVSFAHSRDVIHRDLKPENVMLGQFGEVLVMDWGLAVNLSKTKDFVLGGTPAYMAPEMARHQIELIGNVSDIYLLGAILFQAISGLPPHPGETVTQCVSAAARNQIIPIDQKDELLSIALTAMELDTKARYATVNDFQQAIREYQDHAESISLSGRAEEDLNQAVANQDYQAYSRARFGFQDAVELWPGNDAAAEGFQRATIAHATEALNKQDFDLGMSMLSQSNPQEAPLLVQLEKGKKERESRVRRFRYARRLAFLFLASAVVIAGSAAAFIFKQYQDAEGLKETAIAERGEALKQKAAADEARQKAVDALDLAEERRVEAETAKGEAETNLILAEERRVEAETAKGEAEDNLKLAEERRVEAETATKLQIEAREEADLARKTAEEEKINALTATFDVKQSAIAIKLGKLRSDFTLIRNDIANGNVDDALQNVMRILKNDFATEDENYPISFKGWELYRLKHLALAGNPTSVMLTDDPSMAVAMSADGSTLAVGDSSGVVYIYDGVTRELQRTIEVDGDDSPRISSLALTADASELIVGTKAQQRPNLHFFNPSTGEETMPAIIGHWDGVDGVDLSSDGKTLATCGLDGDGGDRNDEFDYIRRWTRADVGEPFEIASRNNLNVNFYANYLINLAPDNKRFLLVCDSRDKAGPSGEEFIRKVVAIYLDDETGQRPLILKYEGGDITSAVFDPRDESGNSLFVGTDDGQILHWQIKKINEPNASVKSPVVESENLVIEQFIGHDSSSTIRDLDARLIESAVGPLLQLISVADTEDEGVSRNPSFILWDVGLRQPKKFLFGHEGRINACGQSVDGRLVYSISQGRQVRVWNVAEIIDQLSIAGATRQRSNDLPDVNSLDFANNDQWIVGGDRFGRISVWDRSNGDAVASVRIGHQLNQNMQTFLRIETGQMVSASVDRTTRIWEPSTGKLLREWSDTLGLSHFDVSSNGRWVVMGFRVGGDPRLRLVDLDSMEEREIPLTLIDEAFGKNLIPVYGVSISDDGKKLFLTSPRKLYGFDLDSNKSMGVTDPTANQVDLLMLPGDSRVAFLGETNVMLYPTAEAIGNLPASIALLNDQVTGDLPELKLLNLRFRSLGDRTFALVTATQKINSTAETDVEIASWLGVFDATDWDSLKLDDDKYEPTLLHDKLIKLEGEVVGADISADGNSAIALLSSNDVFQIDFLKQSVEKADRLSTIAGDLVERISNSYGVTDLEMSQVDWDPSGHVVLSGPGFAELWNIESDSRVFQISPALPIRSVRFLNDPNSILATHGDGNVRLWAINEGESGAVFSMNKMIRGDFVNADIGPHGETALMLHESGQASIYDTASGELLADIVSADESPITAIDWVADGDAASLLMIGSTGGKTSLHHWSDGELTKAPLSLPDHDSPVTSVAISHDLKYFASGDSSGDGHLIPNPDMWEYEEPLLSISNVGESITDLRFHPSGNRLLVTQGQRSRLWHLDNEKQNLVESVFQLDHDHRVNAATISPDGKLIATAPADEGRMIVWLTKGWEEEPVGENIQDQRVIDREEIEASKKAIADAEAEASESEVGSAGE